MAKAPNYTEAQRDTLVAGYLEVATESEDVRNAYVEEMAAEFGKSARSIRAKLSRENVYLAMKPVSEVTGETPAKKAELAEKLVEVSGLALVSAEKLNKTDLVALIAFAKAATATDEEEADETEE